MVERFERFRFSVPAVPLGKGVFLCFSTDYWRGTVPVPVSVPEKRFRRFRFRFPLIFFSLLFWISLLFYSCKEFLVFLSVFPFFPRNFRGSEEERINPCLFGGFPCHFLKKQGKEDQGRFRDERFRRFRFPVPIQLIEGSDLRTEKAPQRNGVTKILPNVRVNSLVRFAS